MPGQEGDGKSQTVLGLLTRIDLYHHSLSVAAEKIMAQIGDREQGGGDSVAIRERVLDLIGACTEVLASLGGFVDEAESGLVDTTRDVVDLALMRASRAPSATLQLVNIWRVVEATGRLVSVLGDRYGYESLSDESSGVADEEPGVQGAELVKLFAEYEDAMGAEPSQVVQVEPPFEQGVLHWRGKQLFYVERVEKGVRWIELDAESEPRVIGEERGGVEIAEGLSLDGYPLKLRLDVDLDANVVDEYIRRQAGAEHYVSGYQFSRESQRWGSGLDRRRR